MQTALKYSLILAVCGCLSCGQPERTFTNYRAEVSTISGGNHPLIGPAGIVALADGTLYVADQGDNTILKVDPDGSASVWAGQSGQPGNVDNPRLKAQFSAPAGMVMDTDGTIYVVDFAEHTVRKIATDGYVSTLAGNPGTQGWQDGKGSDAWFSNPEGIAFGPQHKLYVSEFGNHDIRSVDLAGNVQTVAGQHGVAGYTNDTGTLAVFNKPTSIMFDSGVFYITDQGSQLVRKMTSTFDVSLFAGLYNNESHVDGDVSVATFDAPSGVTTDRDGNVYVTDFLGYTIREINHSGLVTTIAGAYLSAGFVDGQGLAARFDHPYSIASDGSNIYVADGNHVIRKIVPGAALPY
jgi:streptogramin lyase